MNKVTIDESLHAKLGSLSSEVEVCDESGQTVGYFVPADWHDDLLYAWAKAQVTDEELERARRQVGGQALADILARLESA